MQIENRLFRILLPSLLLLSANVAIAADAPSMDDLCQTVLKGCRRNMTVQFRQADGSEYRKFFDVMYPPVQNRTLVTVFVGETLRLKATVSDDRISELALAADTDSASSVIEISLKQMPDKPDMMLVIRNPFDRLLKYKAAMQVPPANDPMATSTCPVLPGKLGIETWPHPVFQVLLSDFHFLPSLESTTCD